MLLYVQLKNVIFPISFPFPLYQSNTPSLSPISLPSSQFSNCMQKAVMSVCLSWDVRLKKPGPILLICNLLNCAFQKVAVTLTNNEFRLDNVPVCHLKADAEVHDDQNESSIQNTTVYALWYLKLRNLLLYVVCISTSQQVFRMLFAGWNRFFGAKTTLSVTYGTK